MASQPKKTKTTDRQQAAKLWTHEPRIFAEKIFYLNKSTTKYIITGIDPVQLYQLVRICDRATGSFITIKQTDFDEFARLASSVLNSTYTLSEGYIENSSTLSGIKFCYLGSDIWKLWQVDLNYASIIMHKSSFGTFARLEKLIRGRIMTANTTGYLNAMAAITNHTEGMDEAEILAFLDEKITTFDEYSIEHQVISDLICNRESYIEIAHMRDTFYNRNKNV